MGLVATLKRKSGYLPSLDGWRALAILGVLMAHDKTWHFHGHTNLAYRGYGGYGVWLFFAISGILICWRILEDEAALGSFHIGAFYVRRLFRIQPAAWMYLSFIGLLMLLGIVHERLHFWLGAFFLYQNFTWHTFQLHRMLREGYFTGHFWTLSVEEHFYLILSLFLYFCKRYRIALLSFGLVVLLLAQQWGIAHGHFSDDVSNRRTYWEIQFLLFPALLAMLLRIPTVREYAVRYLRPWVVFCATLIAMCVPQAITFGPRALLHFYMIGRGQTTLFYSFSFWVAATMLHPSSWTTRVLELKPLRFLGRISYSLYLWHLLFFSVSEPDPHITWAPLVAAGQQPWRYVSALVAAMLSYYLLERPMMRLGHKLAPPATPGHADLRVTPFLEPKPEAEAPETLQLQHR